MAESVRLRLLDTEPPGVPVGGRQRSMVFGIV